MAQRTILQTGCTNWFHCNVSLLVLLEPVVKFGTSVVLNKGSILLPKTIKRHVQLNSVHDKVKGPGAERKVSKSLRNESPPHTHTHTHRTRFVYGMCRKTLLCIGDFDFQILRIHVDIVMTVDYSLLIRWHYSLCVKTKTRLLRAPRNGTGPRSRHSSHVSELSAPLSPSAPLSLSLCLSLSLSSSAPLLKLRDYTAARGESRCAPVSNKQPL